MKKSMSLVLALCMVLTILPMGISVGAIETGTGTSSAATLVFDMDLSGSTEESVVVADSSNSGITGTITYGLAKNNPGPTYGVNALGTGYLDFRTAGNTSITNVANMAVNVPLTGADGQAVYNADEITVSAWVNSNNTTASGIKDGYIFSFGEYTPDVNQWSFGLLHEIKTTYSGIRAGFEANGTSTPTTKLLGSVTSSSNYDVWPADTYSTAWKHVTYTRKWNQATAATDEAAETGTYTINLYIDGVLTASCVSDTVTRYTYAEKYGTESSPANNVKFVIGNAAGKSGFSYGGSIGDIKLYTGILSANEIVADYDNTKAAFGITSGGEEPAGSTLVFDMDLSSCSAETIDVKDSSNSGKVKEFKYGAAGNGKEKPGYGKNEKGTPYLIFDPNTDSTKVSSPVDVLFNDTSVHDADELTITAWVKETNAENRDGKYLFGFSPNTGTALGYGILYQSNKMRVKLEAAALKQTDSEGNEVTVDSLGDSSYEFGTNTWPTTYKNQWKHVTFTKKWTTTNAATNTGYYEVKAYVDGVQVGSYTNSDAPKVRQKYSDAFPTATYTKIAMGIGGNGTASGNQSFPGYISDFKVWTEVLSTDAIAADYMGTRKNYYDIATTWKSVKFTNGEEQEITDSNGLLASAAKVTAAIEVADCKENAKVILALYDSKGTLAYVNITEAGAQNALGVSAPKVSIDNIAEGSDITKAVVYIWEDTTSISPILPTRMVQAESAPL